MKECAQRVPVKSAKELEKAVNESHEGTGLELVVAVGFNKRDFANGLCKIRTRGSVYPQGCVYPKCSEKTCPIAQQ